MDEGRKQRRRPRPSLSAPTLRLEWPSAMASDNGTHGACHTKHKTLLAPSSDDASVSSRDKRVTFLDSQLNVLWADKYAPLTSNDLAVAPKKVKEIVTWMTESNNRSPKLMILVGNPGIGKSQTVRVLAKEMGWTLHEWTESFSTTTADKMYYGNSPDLLSMDQSSPMASFETFLKQAGAGFSSLMQTSRNKRKRNDSCASSSSIILLEELPHVHGTDAERRFRDCMTNHLRYSHVPTILVYSNVLEGKHRPEDLERLIDRNLLYSPAVGILQMHPPTRARAKRVLERIVKSESLIVPADFYEALYERSGGDLRASISTLQYERTGHWSRAKSTIDKEQEPERDKKLNTFHALGKLLYAKRQQQPTIVEPGLKQWQDGRPLLDFDPEQVIAHSELELSGALAFLEYHSLSFFTDIDDVGQAFALYSDAAFLLDRPLDGRHSIFPDVYVASVAGRATAASNRHPSTKKFFQFTSPKVFEVNRKNNANKGCADQLISRLALSTGDLSLHSFLGISANFTTDCLPFCRLIIPLSVGPSLDSMHSYFGSFIPTSQKMEEENVMLLQEQNDLLQKDDIADFSD
jgi:cell cycle checkpoint protein